MPMASLAGAADIPLRMYLNPAEELISYDDVSVGAGATQLLTQSAYTDFSQRDISSPIPPATPPPCASAMTTRARRMACRWRRAPVW